MKNLCSIRRGWLLATTALAWLMMCVALHAQDVGPASIPFDDQYHSSWTVRDGVPPGLWQTKQTTDGFLWLGSETGLYRFDGIAFTKYLPPKGQKLLKNGPVGALLATPDGGLWIAYRFGGASFIHGDVVTNYPATRDFSETVFAFAQVPDGSLWGATAIGLYRFDGTRWSHVDASWGAPINRVTHLRLAASGDLWFDDGTDYYVLPRGERHFHKTGLPGGKLDITGDGIGWLGIDGSGLYPVTRSADGSWSLGKLLLKENISVVTHTSDGSLWFGAHDGIWRIHNINSYATTPLPAGEVQSMRKADGLSADWVYAITIDREGSVWAMTTNGLDQFRKTMLTTTPLPPDMQHPMLLDEGNGSVLVASNFRAKVLLARVSARGVEPIPTPQITTAIHQIYRDGSGTEWVSADGKLFHLNNTTLTAVPGPADIPGDGVKFRAMTLDHAGALWMSVPDRGVDKIYSLANGSWTRYHGLDSAPTLTATSMLTDHAGNVWIGTGASRIFILDNGKVTRLDGAQGLDSGGVTLLQERGDHIWVGGSENLDYYSQGRFRRLTYDDGSSMAGVTGVAETPSGDVWLNGARGILHITSSEMQAALKQDRPRIHVQVLNYLDGGFETPIVRIQSSTIAQPGNGRIYFLSRQGVTWIDTTNLLRNAIVPGVFITSTVVDGHAYSSLASLHIEKGSQNFQINYTATSMLVPARVKFRYKLDGFDREWQEVGTRRQAYYTHLPPGRYAFLVMASNNDGVWSTTPARWDFYLPPTFLQGIWFKLLCVGALLALFSAALLLRVRFVTTRMQQRLYERLAERERIARDLHDTFFQGIQGLFLRFNTGTAMLPPDEPARPIFLNALEQSDRVMAEGRELVLDLRADDAVTASLAEDLARVDPQSFGTTQPAYKVSAVGQVRRLHPVCGSELLRIGLEAVHNAYKHANATAVEVEILYEKEFLKMRIRDDGRGIDEDVIRDGRRPGHLGLIGMNERATRIGARYSLWSKRGQGTEIEVEVPAKIAYGTHKPLDDRTQNRKRSGS
jgi:signal transduction histidine kinase/ligand-binding sensor domain-containing protein